MRQPWNKNSMFSAAWWKIPNLIIIWEGVTLATELKSQLLKLVFHKEIKIVYTVYITESQDGISEV